MRRTTPALPAEPVEPANPLSQTIKGRCAPWAHPKSHFPAPASWRYFIPKDILYDTRRKTFHRWTITGSL